MLQTKFNAIGEFKYLDGTWSNLRGTTLDRLLIVELDAIMKTDVRPICRDIFALFAKYGNDNGVVQVLKVLKTSSNEQEFLLALENYYWAMQLYTPDETENNGNYYFIQRNNFPETKKYVAQTLVDLWLNGSTEEVSTAAFLMLCACYETAQFLRKAVILGAQFSVFLKKKNYHISQKFEIPKEEKEFIASRIREAFDPSSNIRHLNLLSKHLGMKDKTPPGIYEVLCHVAVKAGGKVSFG